MSQPFRVLAAALVLAAAASAPADDGAAPPKSPPAGAAAAKPAAPAAKPADAKPVDAKASDAKPAAAKPAAAASPVAAYVTPRSLDDALRILGRRRVDVEFREMAMDDVVSFIAKVGRVNVMVSPEFVQKAQGPLPLVTLTLRDVSLRQLTEMVAKITGSSLMLRDGVLQFTTAADARGKPALRIFPIAELTFRIRNFPGPDINLRPSGAEFEEEKESDQPSPFDDPQTVVDMVKKFTGEGTWEDDDVSISADGNKLVVRQYPKVLREIASFLALLRAAK